MLLSALPVKVSVVIAMILVGLIATVLQGICNKADTVFPEFSSKAA